MVSNVSMSNQRVLPQYPAEKLKELQVLADIHVLRQHCGATHSYRASKVDGMLVSGRTVMPTTEAGAEISEVVQGYSNVVPLGALL